MLGVVWTAENIATLAHVVLAALLSVRLGVMVALAQRGELIEGRKRRAASRDRDAVVNHSRRLDFTNLKARFA
jgi:hypothetical protein